MKPLLSLLGLATLMLWTGCSREAVPFRYGKDECAHCKMTLVDQRFGAELITAKGKVLLFDDLSCLFQFERANPQHVSSPPSIYVIDYTHPAALVPAEQAVFLAGDAIRSPMGSGIVAFANDQARQGARPQMGSARPYAWSELPRTP